MAEPVQEGASAISIAFFVAAYGEVLAFEFSHPADLVRVKKRCIPNIIAEVPHLNLNLTFKWSG
jgi:hypothetical protein